MNKAELITAVSEKASISKKDAEGAINAFIATVSDTLKDGDKIQLIGFGTFETTKREARTCRNPRNGSTIQLEERLMPKFRPGKALKDYIS